jgi:hypothetical protein
MTNRSTTEVRLCKKQFCLEGPESYCFALEAKMGPNHWQAIDEVYPQIELASLYLSSDEAKSAKNRLKGLLLGPYRNQLKKRPIRIQKISKILPVEKLREKQH